MRVSSSHMTRYPAEQSQLAALRITEPCWLVQLKLDIIVCGAFADQILALLYKIWMAGIEKGIALIRDEGS